MSIITDANGGSTATETSFRAEIEAWKAILKEDETFRCSSYDGSSPASVAAIQAKCQTSEYGKYSLYCRCDTEAASPDMITLNVTGTILTVKDTCDSPEVPPAYKDSKMPSYKITDDAFASAGSAYSVEAEALLGALKLTSEALFDASAEPGKTFSPNYATWVDRMLALLKGEEEALMAAADVYSAPYATSITDSSRVAAADLKNELFKAFLDAAVGQEIVVAAPAGDAASEAELGQAALDAGATAGVVAEALQHAETSSAAIASLVTDAATTAQYYFMEEGNLMSTGFKEVAQCVSRYAEQHADALFNPNPPTLLGEGAAGESWQFTLKSEAGGVVANSVMSMAVDDINEATKVVAQPANCSGYCYGVSCNGLQAGFDALWDVFEQGYNPYLENGDPHPEFCKAGREYTTAALETMGWMPAGMDDHLIDPIVREYIDKDMAENLEMVYNPANPISVAYATGMKAALNAAAPIGHATLNTVALEMNAFDELVVTEDDFREAGRLGVIANNNARVDNATEQEAEYWTAVEISWHICQKRSPGIFPDSDKESMYDDLYLLTEMGDAVRQEHPDWEFNEIMNAVTPDAIQTGVSLVMLAYANPCMQSAGEFGLAINDTAVGHAAFKTAFRAAAGVDPSVPDDKYTFNSVTDAFATAAGMLQVVGMSIDRTDDPCLKGNAPAAEILETAVDAGLLDLWDGAKRDEKVANAMAMIDHVAFCTEEAMYTIGAGVGGEFAFVGKPDRDGVLRTPKHFSRDVWDEATVGFTARPLPKTWGVDRWPCGRATALDTFREGDFDYPYQLKQIERIGFQTYMFAAGSPFLAEHRELAQCVEHGFMNPLKQRKYLDAIAEDYSGVNSAAIEAAEAAFEVDLGTDILTPPVTAAAGTAISVAANKAAVAFVAAGGDIYHAPDQAWLLSTTSVVNAAAAGLTTADVSAAAAAVISSAIVDGVSDAADLATTFAEAASGSAAVAGDATIIAALLAGESAYSASASLVPFSSATASSTFSKALLDAAVTVALLVPNILLPRVQEVGAAVKTISTLEASYSSQKDWACGEDRTGEFETAMQLLMSIGYWWRPSYGDHWSYQTNRDPATTVLEGVSEAAKIYYRYNQEWDPQECLVRNDDTEEMLGNYVGACMLPWAPQFGMPMGLVMADIAWNLTAAEATAAYDAELALGNKTHEQAKAKMMAENAASGILSVGARRVGVNDFAPDHWLHIARLNELLGRETTAEERFQIHYDMQGEMIAHLEKLWAREDGTGFEDGGEFADVKFAFAAGRSISDLITSGTAVDLIPIIAVYVIMILYVGGSLLGWKSNVRSHFWLGISGVVIIALAVGTSLGLAGWFGIMFTPLVTNVAPFVAVGIGIDDMLVIAHEYAHLLRLDAARPSQSRLYGKDSVRRLMQDILSSTGSSVFFTTTTNFIAFMVATVCPIKVVELLAQVMAICVVVNFIFLLLFFIPLIYLDAYRSVRRHGRECCCIGTCCAAHDEAFSNDADADADEKEGAASEEENSLSKKISHFLKDVYGPFLTRPLVKAFVIVLFLAFFGIQLGFLVTEAKLGIEYADITKEGTYQFDLFTQLGDKFQYYNQNLVQTATNFAAVSTQVGFQMASKNFAIPDLVEKSVMGQGTGGSWLTMVADYKPQVVCDGSNDMEVFTTATPDSFEKLDMCSLVDQDAVDDWTNETYPFTPESDFYYAFGTFMNGLGGLMAGQFVCKNTTSDEITSCFNIPAAYPTDGTPVDEQSRDVVLVAAQEMVFTRDIADTPDHLEVITDTRRYMDSCQALSDSGWLAGLVGPDEPVDEGFWAYATGYTYRFMEQYLFTKRDLIRTVLYAALGVFIATYLFLMSWRSSLVLCLVIAMTVVELAGIIPESDAVLKNGLRLNAFSIVNLTICVGMTIEFTAHIVHCFITTPGEDSAEGRTKRVVAALGVMGPPVIHGGVTSLIASAVLGMSDMPFVRAYYFFMFFLMVLIASVNGLVLLPVLLSIFGDGPLEDGDSDSSGGGGGGNAEPTSKIVVMEMGSSIQNQTTVIENEDGKVIKTQL